MGSSSPNNSVDSYIRERTSSDLSGKKSPSIGWSEESSRHSVGSSTHRGKSAEVPSSGIDRREISAVRDRVPFSSRVPTVVPSLRDDTDSDGAGNRYADDERESADENVSGESRKNEMVDLGPTTSTRESVGRTTDFCLLPGPLTIRIPRDTDRPSDCPEGFICLFEGFFTETGLRFPIPDFLMRFCRNRQIAISQLTVASIRTAACLQMLCARCGIPLSVELMEELTSFSKVPHKLGQHYISSVRGFKILENEPSKTRDWLGGYFYAKVDRNLVEDPSAETLREQAPIDWKQVPCLKHKKQNKRKPQKQKSSARPKKMSGENVNLATLMREKRARKEAESKPRLAIVDKTHEDKARLDVAEKNRKGHEDKTKKGTSGAERRDVTDVTRVDKARPITVGQKGSSGRSVDRERSGPDTFGSKRPCSSKEVAPALDKRRRIGSGDVDLSAGPRLLAIADHSFRYEYKVRDSPFSADRVECARFLRKNDVLFSTPPEDNMCAWQAVWANNLLISRYDRNLRSAREKILVLEGKLKNAERTIADNNQQAKAGLEELKALKKETVVLKAERSKEAATLENVLRQQTLLEARLAEEKEIFWRFREEKFAEEMRRRMHAQATGTLSCLKFLADEDKIPIPASTFEEFEEWKEKIDAFNVTELVNGGRVITPVAPHGSTENVQGSEESPFRINQFGSKLGVLAACEIDPITEFFTDPKLAALVSAGVKKAIVTISDDEPAAVITTEDGPVPASHAETAPTIGDSSRVTPNEATVHCKESVRRLVQGVSRGTSSDSDDELDSSSTSIRGYFGCPRRDRSPSPICVVEDRVIRRPALPVGEPLYPWRRPPLIAASPSFTPVGRDFVPGSVKYPADLLRHLHPEEAARFRYWFRTLEGQHRAYCRRHAELLRMMQEMELGMRRLEADPKDWERFGLGKLNPLPPFLRAYCRAKLHEDEASSSRGP
ncbi:myosin heavy chain-like protein [Arabidopsis thaliana]|uniref:Myosin heavy chain-like protein n=1 Tax=Arabidopsis thaliana TaxID=3702 RepID=F4KA42_ARATH|nr:myosin heavy chain-like protein [Arabidopsis thaliana]AED94277.1 myosin heavy chain-like protein [Arabidopsis thaliana]|eukprot:NP_198635.2 myosin heavy chain-like protein [Arabidopsis thaliana]